MKTYNIRTSTGRIINLSERDLIVCVDKYNGVPFFGWVHAHQLKVGDTVEVPGYGMCRQEVIDKIEVTRDCTCNQRGGEECPQHGHKRV